MGYWQETCALTNLPIYEDDPCVVVVMDEVFTTQLENNPELGRFNSDFAFKHLESVNRGTYNDYGWIKELKDKKLPDKNGINRPYSQRRVTIFFHARVWDEAVKAGIASAKQWEKWKIEEANQLNESRLKFKQMHPNISEDILDGIYPKAPTQDLVDFKAVSEVAFWTRRDLMASHYFHGCQANENQYYDLVHKLTEEIWNEIQHKFDKD